MAFTRRKRDADVRYVVLYDDDPAPYDDGHAGWYSTWGPFDTAEEARQWARTRTKAAVEVVELIGPDDVAGDW